MLLYLLIIRGGRWDLIKANSVHIGSLLMERSRFCCVDLGRVRLADNNYYRSGDQALFQYDPVILCHDLDLDLKAVSLIKKLFLTLIILAAIGNSRQFLVPPYSTASPTLPTLSSLPDRRALFEVEFPIFTVASFCALSSYPTVR